MISLFWLIFYSKSMSSESSFSSLALPICGISPRTKLSLSLTSRAKRVLFLNYKFSLSRSTLLSCQPSSSEQQRLGRISFYFWGNYFLETGSPLEAGFLGMLGRLKIQLLRPATSDLLSLMDKSDVVWNIITNEQNQKTITTVIFRINSAVQSKYALDLIYNTNRRRTIGLHVGCNLVTKQTTDFSYYTVSEGYQQYLYYMDTESIVRRIIELKKASVQLKQTTDDPTKSNTDLMQTLFQFGRSISALQNDKPEKQKVQIPLPPQNGQSPDREPNQNQPVSNVLMQLFQNVTKKQTLHRSEVESSVSALESSSFAKAYQEPLTPVQQISQLRQNNSDIEEEIRNLRQKLKRLQEIERQQRQQQWKDGLPYFALNIPRLRIFYTKLTIDQRDYDKIDYCMYSVGLNLQKIILTQLPQNEVSSRPPKSITLMLADLKQVNYHNKSNYKKGAFTSTINQNPKEEEDELLIVYHFKHKKAGQAKSRSKSGRKSAFSRAKLDEKIKQEDDEIIQTLFMKFDNEAQLKQWDLAIFINFKIMEDLNKGDAKIENSSMNSSTIVYQEPNKKKQSENEKGKNLQFIDLIERMKKTKVKTNQNKTFQSENESDDEADEEKNGRKPPSLQKNYNDDNIDTPVVKDNSNIKIVDDMEIHENRDQSLEEDIINKQRSNTSHFGGSSNIMSMQEKVKQAEQQKIQEEELRKQKLTEMEENKRKQAERMEELRKTQYELSVRKARQILRKGYSVTKYAKSAFSPHEKKIYLSEDGKKLFWRDLEGGGQPKFVLISDITSVNQAVYGKGISTHLSQKKFNENKGCYAVINLKSKDRKAIDLSIKDERTMESFCKALQLYRRSLKEIF